MGNEDLANGLDLAARHQRLDLAPHLGQGLLQALALLRRGLAPGRVVEGPRHADMGRADGDAGGRRHGRQHLAGLRCNGLGSGRLGRFRGRLGSRCVQRLHGFAEAGQDGVAQGRQGLVGDRRFGQQLQHLPSAHAQRQQFAQAAGADGGLAAVGDTDADFPGKGLGRLGQLLGGAGMQAVGVGQGHAQARPVGDGVTAEGFQQRTAGDGVHDLAAAPFHQQAAQALQQRLVGIPQARQAEQAGQGLALVLQGRRRGDEGQARPLHGLVGVQPPEAVAQGQRLALQQGRRKALVDAAGAAQQAGALQGQLVEVFGLAAEGDQLVVQRQVTGSALEQLEDGLGALGRAQGLAQLAFAEGTGQQLQQAQVLVGLGGDADGQVHALAIAPLHAAGEMQQAYAGGVHQVAGLGGAVGNRDALAEAGGALRFAGLQRRQVAVGGQAVRYQPLRHLAQGVGLVRRGQAHGHLSGGQFEHACLQTGLGALLSLCHLHQLRCCLPSRRAGACGP